MSEDYEDFSGNCKECEKPLNNADGYGPDGDLCIPCASDLKAGWLGI